MEQGTSAPSVLDAFKNGLESLITSGVDKLTSHNVKPPAVTQSNLNASGINNPLVWVGIAAAVLVVVLIAKK